MEAKGQRSVKGGQKGHKRPVQGTKKPRLDGTTVGYFRRVSDRLKEGFTEEEEKGEAEVRQNRPADDHVTCGSESGVCLCVQVCLCTMCCRR